MWQPCGFSLDAFGRVRHFLNFPLKQSFTLLFNCAKSCKTKKECFGLPSYWLSGRGLLALARRFSVGISWQLAVSDSGICPVRYHVSCMEATYITRARFVEQHAQHHSCWRGPLVFVRVTHVVLEKTGAPIGLHANICHTRHTSPPSPTRSIKNMMIY